MDDKLIKNALLLSTIRSNLDQSLFQFDNIKQLLQRPNLDLINEFKVKYEDLKKVEQKLICCNSIANIVNKNKISNMIEYYAGTGVSTFIARTQNPELKAELVGSDFKAYSISRGLISLLGYHDINYDFISNISKWNPMLHNPPNKVSKITLISNKTPSTITEINAVNIAIKYKMSLILIPYGQNSNAYDVQNRFEMYKKILTHTHNIKIIESNNSIKTIYAIH